MGKLDAADAQMLAEAKKTLEPIAKQITVFREHEWEYVLPDLWRMHEADPANRDVTRLIVDSYYNLAVRDLQRADAKKAVENFQEALALQQDDDERRAAPRVRADLPGAAEGPALPDLRQIPAVPLMRRPDKPKDPTSPCSSICLWPVAAWSEEDGASPRSAAEADDPPGPGPATRHRARHGRCPCRTPSPSLWTTSRVPTSEFAVGGTVSRPAGPTCSSMPPSSSLALLGVRGMGVRPSLADWPAFALFLLSFSFLYTVVPLAFWGHTLGMAWGGLTSRNRDGEPLTFDQTARRWLGGILTWPPSACPSW